VTLQNLFRVKIARERAFEQRCHCASIIIQKHGRGFLMLKNYRVLQAKKKAFIKKIVSLQPPSFGTRIRLLLLPSPPPTPPLLLSPSLPSFLYGPLTVSRMFSIRTAHN
jgi:hypothetical protein